MIHRIKKKTMTFYIINCTFAAKKDNDNVKSKILSLLLNNETKENQRNSYMKNILITHLLFLGISLIYTSNGLCMRMF